MVTRTILTLLLLLGLVFGTQIDLNGQETVESSANDLTSAGDLLASLSGMSKDQLDPLEKSIPTSEARIAQAENLLTSIDPKTKKSIAKVVGGLAVVIAIFLTLTTFLGKKRQAAGAMPPMEILAKSRLNKAQQMQLVRVGSRLLLLANSDKRVDTLTEFTDPQEILEIEQMLRNGNTSFFAQNRTQNTSTSGASRNRNTPVYEA